MVFNLTAVAAVAGLVLGRNVDASLILAIPLLSSALGLMWFGHHIDIEGIGAYLRVELWQWEPSWEHWIRKHRHARWWDRTFWFAVVLVFCGAPSAALAIGLPKHDASLVEWLLWSAGVVLTVSTTVRFLLRGGNLRAIPEPQSSDST
jgi:uncharacterized membrane protein